MRSVFLDNLPKWQTVKPPPGCERDEYRLAVISLFFLFIVALLEETAIVFVALRGEQTQARRACMLLRAVRRTGGLRQHSLAQLSRGDVVFPAEPCSGWPQARSSKRTSGAWCSRCCTCARHRLPPRPPS